MASRSAGFYKCYPLPTSFGVPTIHSGHRCSDEEIGQQIAFLLMQKLGLVFVAVYQSALKLAYVDRLLERIRGLFAEEYIERKYDYITFDATFKKELERAERAAEARSNIHTVGNGSLLNGKVCCTCGSSFTAYSECLVPQTLQHVLSRLALLSSVESRQAAGD